MSAIRIFLIYLRLGSTSFGGPVAHLGYFREEFVKKRRWLDEATFADLVALCQLLPGPASSQVGAATGLIRGGLPGMAAAWLGFTLPSALAMGIIGIGLSRLVNAGASGWLHGLKLVAVAVVAQAVVGMGKNLCPDRTRATIAAAAAAAACFLPGVWGQIGVILGGAAAGLALLRPSGRRALGALGAVGSRAPVAFGVTGGPAAPPASLHAPAHPEPGGTSLPRAPGQWLPAMSATIPPSGPAPATPDAIGVPSSVDPAGARLPQSRKLRAAAALLLFFALLFELPLGARVTSSPALSLASRFFSSGALVFGGGHVVLPLLKAELVPTGLLAPDAFLAGYGAAQAMPGPLFTVAACFGAAAKTELPAWLAAAASLVAIFLPGLLLVVGVLPFWERLRHQAAARAALGGVNAAVVGILLAALYDPVFTSAVHSRADFAVAAVAYLLLAYWRLPPWLVVVVTAAVGAGLPLVLGTR